MADTDTWTLREIARQSGRPWGVVAALARRGLIPGYAPGPQRRYARIPADVAADVVLVLRHEVCSRRFAELMRSDPAAAQEGAAALARLAARAETLGVEQEEATAA